MAIKNVAIVGGTHGNELIGVYLLKRWEQMPQEIMRPTIHTDLFLGNPKANELNRRFVDEDLNRCFLHASLEAEKLSYEAHRAAYLDQKIGPKGSPQFDLIIDLHTTTSNSGMMVILFDTNSFNLHIAAYITQQMPDAKIHYIPPSGGDTPYLSSICPQSIVIEVGPIPQALLRSDISDLTNNAVRHGLDYVNAVNLGQKFDLPEVVEVFCAQEVVYFPQENGAFSAIVHERLQDSDYQALNTGDPMFETLKGETICYAGSETVYPVFINEAAYYYKGIAMTLCTKETLSLVSDQ